ncbi:MAG: CvpA family protein [bacterium]
MFSFFDVILLILLAGFVFFGLFLGLIKAIGEIIGIIAGAWVAGNYFLLLAGWITNLTGISHNIIKVGAFLFLFILVNRLIGLIFWILDKIFHILAIIPFLKTINRLAGAILGLFEGAMVLGLTIYILSKYSISAWLDGSLAVSKVAPVLVRVARILLPLIPAAIRAIKGIF